MVLTAVCLAAAFGLAVTMNLLSVSPTELAYKSENQALRDQLAASQERIDQFGKALDELVENDRELYRVILQADEVSDDILQVGTGGVDAPLEGADADLAAGGYAGEGVGYGHGVTVVAHHHHGNALPAQCVIDPADGEGGNPFHSFLLKNTGYAGGGVDSHR